MTAAPWWLDAAATILGLGIGAWIIACQLRASRRSELKLKLFEALRRGLKQATESVLASKRYAYNAFEELPRYRAAISRGERTLPISQRIPQLHALHLKSGEDVGALVTLLEAHDIVSEHFWLFRRALACAQIDAMLAFNAMSTILHRTYPVEIRGDIQIPATTDDEQAELEVRIHDYYEAMQTLTHYIADIEREAQNLLLADIFKRKSASRIPADNRHWVLRTDDPAYLVKLKEHFSNQHRVAQANREIEIQTASRALKGEN